MGFGDLNSANGQEALNTFLQDRSYMEGYVPSQSDVAIFESMKSAPDAKFNHALRWFNHIASYKSSFPSLPGIKKPIAQYGPADVSNGKAASDSGKKTEDSDSDFDLMESDDEEKKAETAKRLAEYAAKKAKKPAVIAKSNIILDVKVWDDETDLKEVEALVRSIEMDGLLWGSAKIMPVGYGINKLQISCVIVDDKVSTDDLEEKITANEDHVQSVDIVAFNKI